MSTPEKKWWALKPGPEREAAKQAAEKAETWTRTVIQYGVAELTNPQGEKAYRGGSGYAHRFDPENEASRRAAMMAARSTWQYLPRCVAFTCDDCSHLILTGQRSGIVRCLLTDDVCSFSALLREVIAAEKNHRETQPDGENRQS